MNKGGEIIVAGTSGVLDQFDGVWDHLAGEQQSEREKKRSREVGRVRGKRRWGSGGNHGSGDDRFVKGSGVSRHPNRRVNSQISCSAPPCNNSAIEVCDCVWVCVWFLFKPPHGTSPSAPVPLP